MKIISVNCPNCSKSVNIDLDNLTTFCPSCGSKLMLDIEQLQQILVAKEATKQKIEEELTKREISKSDNEAKIIYAAVALSVFLGIVIMFIFAFLASR